MKWSVFVVCAALLASVARAQDRGVALAGNQTEDRLLTAIRDPKVLRRDGDAITVGFFTGPNLPKTQFVVKCVAGDGVLKVETGSAEATAESTFSNTDDAIEYQNTLAGANTDPDTQETIVEGLSQETNVVVSDIENSGNLPPPYAPDSGTARRLNRRRLFDIGSDVGL
ncbi:hypothetical protein M9434_006983 [Picochlorum sp. BPE23]|nr:hypothetical protein M9434_006983 [Picochlorum sp. BPE23]